MAKKVSKSSNSGWCFPPETVKFLCDLKSNNNREWFAEHKAEYEAALKSPAQAFCALMTEELNQLTGMSHKSKTFRIHRDLRFSKDKTPYNTHLHISFHPEAASNPAGWFFGLEPDRLVLGAGVFAFGKSDLDVFRKRIDDDDGKKLVTLLGKLGKQGVELHEPELKRVPSPYPADHSRADLLRHKGLTVWQNLMDTKAASRSDIIQKCRSSFATFKPMFDWLTAADRDDIS